LIDIDIDIQVSRQQIPCMGAATLTDLRTACLVLCLYQLLAIIRKW